MKRSLQILILLLSLAFIAISLAAPVAIVPWINGDLSSAFQLIYRGAIVLSLTFFLVLFALWYVLSGGRAERFAVAAFGLVFFSFGTLTWFTARNSADRSFDMLTLFGLGLGLLVIAVAPKT